MMEKVELEVRDVFGIPKAYPANNTADLFCHLLGMTTLTYARLATISQLGFEIVLRNYPSVEWFEYRDSRDQELA
jgi:hypothetical protein